eukprot:scaffold34129_cov112-Isochrysis_galbana.AAC.4
MSTRTPAASSGGTVCSCDRIQSAANMWLTRMLHESHFAEALVTPSAARVAGRLSQAPRHFALDPDVVHVETRRLVTAQLRLVANLLRDGALCRIDLAIVDRLDANRHFGQHPIVGRVADGLDTVRVVVGHGGVPRVLERRVGQPVADSHALQVHLEARRLAVTLENGKSHVRRVVAAVRLSEDVQRQRRVLRVGGEELEQECVHILPHAQLVVVVVARVAIGKADARRLIDPKHRRIICPREWVGHGVQRPTLTGDRARPILVEERQHA